MQMEDPMPRLIRRRWLVGLVAGSLMASLLAGCGDDKGTNAKEEPPEIPPASTFVMDFSDFTAVTLAGPGQGGGGRAAFADSRANWTSAAGNVAVWNFIITVGLAVPAAAFLEAFHHQPVRETDGTWVWSYNVEVAHALHLAELHGKATDDGIQWAMHVSKEDAYSDFIWYTGESNVGGTEGTWPRQLLP